MAGKASAKARKARKQLLIRIVTITVAVMLVGGILLATFITRIY